MPDSPPGPSAPSSRGRTAVTTAAVGLLLALGAVGAASRGDWRIATPEQEVPTPEPLPTGDPSPDEQETGDQEVPAFPEGIPDDSSAVEWVQTLVLAILAVVGLALLILLVRELLKRRRRPVRVSTGGVGLAGARGDADADVTETLADGVAHARRAIEDDPQPSGDAVLAAWVALESSAAELGSGRDPAATPTEFTLALLRRTSADPAAVDDLRAVYLRARFASGEVSSPDVAAARAALRTIEETIGT